MKYILAVLAALLIPTGAFAASASSSATTTGGAVRTSDRQANGPGKVTATVTRNGTAVVSKTISWTSTVSKTIPAK